MENPLPVEVTSIPDGRYLIKSRAADFYWVALNNRITKVDLYYDTMETAKKVQLLPGERAFSNYSSVQKIILFQSGTSHKMLMLTSL